MKGILGALGVLATAALALFSSAPVIAQDTDAEEGNDGQSLICVSVAIGWSGTADDRARILTRPVPQSFVRMLREGGCTSWSLRKSSLLDWHLRHGDENSALAAVRFLEDEFDLTLPPDFPERLEAQWNAVIADREKLLERARKANPDWNEPTLFNEVDQRVTVRKSVIRLREQTDALASAEFIAGEYTRAAEAFNSRVLLQEARRVHSPAMAAMAFLDQRMQSGGFDAGLAGRFRPGYRSDRMSPAMRDINLAVTEARVARDATTLEAAAALLREYYMPDGKTYPYPDLLTFIQRAYEDDDEACLPDERNSRDGYRERCRENGFEEFALSYWYQRSRLEILARDLDVDLGLLARNFAFTGPAKQTVDLFMRRAWAMGLRYNEEPVPPQAVRLLLGMGEAIASGLARECENKDRDIESLLYDSLNPISRALSLANPSDQPELYKEAAEARLRVQKIIVACGQSEPEPKFTRDAMLAQSFLDQYDALIAQD